MRADLLNANAAIDWAEAQLPLLGDKIESWRESGAYVVVQEFDPQRGKDAIKINVGKPLPLLINAEAGAIINSIRSSLDLLITALAERNGHAAPTDTYFPIYKSLARFSDPKDSTHEKIRRISAADAAEIKKLCPYPGGNDHLVALHQLDIVRKHQRLVEGRAEISRVNLTGWGLNAEFPPTWIRLEDDAPHMWVNAGAKDYKLEVTVEVTLRQPLARSRGLLLQTLHEFSGVARGIIRLFDI